MKKRFALSMIIFVTVSLLPTIAVMGNESIIHDGTPPQDLLLLDLDLLQWKSELAISNYLDYFGTHPFIEVFKMTAEIPTDNSEPDIVYVIVEDSLWEALDTNKIDRYHQDLESDGYSCTVWVMSGGNHLSLRDWLIVERANLAGGKTLEGCVFIGDIPAAWYEMDIQWEAEAPIKHEEFPIDLFFMDLDGYWGDEDTDGMFDTHIDGTGDVGPEIWVGRLKADNLSGVEEDLVENYFDKNHDYRSGSLSITQRAMVYIDDDWAPNTGIKNEVALAFPYPLLIDNDLVTEKVHYMGKLDFGWAFVHLMCHGSSTTHTFKILDPADSSKRIWDGQVSGHGDVRVRDPATFFYNLFVCSGARFTSTNNLGSWYVFAPTYGLAAVGSTKTGSMGQFSDFYTPMGNGETLGEAFQDWFEARGESSRAWFYGMTILGDPTLKPAGKHEVRVYIPDLLSAVGVVHYTQGGVDKLGNIENWEWVGLVDHGSSVWIDNIIPLSPTIRLLPLGTSQWTVAGSLFYEVPALEQEMLTINTFNVPGSNPVSISYWLDGVIQTAQDVSELSPFTEWCDFESSIEATQEVQVSSSEKYRMICWTADENRYSPASITIDEDVQTYNAHYVGLSKQHSSGEAQLAETVTITVEVINAPTGSSSDTVVITDALPNEMSYLVGSAKIDGVSITPIVTKNIGPEAYEQLTFTVDGFGNHIIVYETIINKVYATDSTIENTACAEFQYQNLPIISVDVSSAVIVHPYQGETLSKTVDGPVEVQMFTETSWRFTFIVKNNYDTDMTDPVLKDNFPAELVYDPDTILANLESNHEFTSSKGKSPQTRLQWMPPELDVGEAYLLQLTMKTGMTPSKTPKQRYTSPGLKVLNQGANLKYRIDGKRRSESTNIITVIVLPEI